MIVEIDEEKGEVSLELSRKSVDTFRRVYSLLHLAKYIEM